MKPVSGCVTTVEMAVLLDATKLSEMSSKKLTAISLCSYMNSSFYQLCIRLQSVELQVSTVSSKSG